MLIITFILLFFILVYVLVRLKYTYWEKRGVAGPKPTFFFGNIGPTLYMKRNLGDIISDIYREHENAPYVGIYKVLTPALLLRDLELIKCVLSKNFSNFESNELHLDPNNDRLLGRNPFILNGELWKTTRNEFLHCFTSSKMKSLYPLLNQSAEQLVDFISKHKTNFNTKDLCTKYTLNNIASCAFGFDGQCYEDNSEFEQLAMRFFSPGNSTAIKMFLIMLFPSLANRLPVKLTPKDVEDKLIEIVTENIRSRKENNFARRDYLNTLMEMNSNQLDNENTMLHITAHVANFFIDGFETSSIAMSYFLYYIAANDNIQTKLRDEINEYYKKESRFTYEIIKEMEYLDACFAESMRLSPAAFNLTKLCTKDFRYNDLLIEKGTSIVIPYWAIQNDPKYFDEPENYIPERFLSHNKDKITKGSYFPFGDGPRNCPGQNFAVLQIKAAVVHVIKNFKLMVNKKTQTPFKNDPLYGLLIPIGGIWVDFEEI